MPQTSFRSPASRPRRLEKQPSKRQLNFQSLESRRLLAADLSAESPSSHADPMDVNADGQITAADALMVVNRLRLESGGSLDESAFSSSAFSSSAADINGDGRTTSLDALMIINRLNQSPSTIVQAESEAVEIMVINTLDSGPGSLRQAIIDANASAMDAEIGFAIPTSDAGWIDVDNAIPTGDPNADVFRIQPLTPLPSIQNAAGHAVTLDATTQSSFNGDNNPFGPEVWLDGSGLTSGEGIVVTSANVKLNSLAISNFPLRGILADGDDFELTNSYVGTDPTGTQRQPNSDIGVLVRSTGVQNGINLRSASNVRIGGPTAAEQNVISGNTASSIFMQFIDNTNITIENNILGSDVDGEEVLGDPGNSVRAENASDVVIRDNVMTGIENFAIGATNINNLTVTGNLVGTNLDGTAAVGEFVHSFEIANSQNVIIGGPDAEDGNIVSGGLGIGVRMLGTFDGLLIEGNRIGTTLDGSAAIPNDAGISESQRWIRNRRSGKPSSWK